MFNFSVECQLSSKQSRETRNTNRARIAKFKADGDFGRQDYGRGVAFYREMLYLSWCEVQYKVESTYQACDQQYRDSFLVDCLSACNSKWNFKYALNSKWQVSHVHENKNQ